METTKSKRIPWAVIAAALVAVPFLAGALVLGWQAAVLPKTASQLALARMLGAALFSFGFALALVSSVVALCVKAVDRRTLATAGMLLGCSHIALGFVVRRTIENSTLNSPSSLLPVMVPVLLWAASIWLAVGSARTSPKKPEDAPDKPASEEQPQLLSPP